MFGTTREYKWEVYWKSNSVALIREPWQWTFFRLFEVFTNLWLVKHRSNKYTNLEIEVECVGIGVLEVRQRSGVLQRSNQSIIPLLPYSPVPYSRQSGDGVLPCSRPSKRWSFRMICRGRDRGERIPTSGCHELKRITVGWEYGRTVGYSPLQSFITTIPKMCSSAFSMGIGSPEENIQSEEKYHGNSKRCKFEATGKERKEVSPLALGFPPTKNAISNSKSIRRETPQVGASAESTLLDNPEPNLDALIYFFFSTMRWKKGLPPSAMSCPWGLLTGWPEGKTVEARPWYPTGSHFLQLLHNLWIIQIRNTKINRIGVNNHQFGWSALSFPLNMMPTLVAW